MTTLEYQSLQRKPAFLRSSNGVSVAASSIALLFYVVLRASISLDLWPPSFSWATPTAVAEVGLGASTLAVGSVSALLALRRPRSARLVVLAWLLLALNVAYWVWLLNKVHSLRTYMFDV
jgi:hypothetical protein